jgi:type IX secretion system substrate protein
MKRSLIILFIVIPFISQLFAYTVSPVNNDNALSQRNSALNETRDRIVPDWEWIVPPQPLAENYADYFQCNNDTPISVQPGEDGGIYIVYRVKTQAGESSIYCTYIDETGEVVSTEDLEYAGFYPDAHVDHATGNLFTSWHGPISGSEEIGDFLLYDLYHLTGAPGNWKDDPILVIDPANAATIFPHINDEFYWPQVKTGPSPEPDMQRVYLIANNNAPSTGGTEYPTGNPLICYADFDANDLENQSDLEWEYTSIPQLDNFHQEIPEWARIFSSWTIIENQVIFMGYLTFGDGPDQIVCLTNDNYGEGEWVYYSQEWIFDEENPEYFLPGNPEPQYLFGEGADPRWVFMHTSRFNLVPSNDNQQVTFPGAMAIMIDDNYYNPLAFMIYPKTFNFDLNTHQFSFTNIYPAALQPWDLDGDGEIDEFDEDGYPLWLMDWPIFHYSPSAAFHYNQYYLTSNPESGTMAYIWVDGQKAAAAQAEIPGYEGWEETPELAICFSQDMNENWYDPIFLNANPQSDNYCPELEGMIPCFAYPGDLLESDGDSAYILHLFFLDDNSYGSYHSQNHGENAGSTFMYASIRIEEPSANSPDEIIPELISSHNYPNPFNPITTIEFELDDPSQVNITIYNIRGQKIQTLTNDFFTSGKHQLTWNAENTPSGLYFYKITTKLNTITQKMILMK